MRSDIGLFPAVLRHWRARRGWSQLDLALAANVSARHVSFLETGRAQPSRDMVLRLGETFDLSLRDRNAMLRAAGFEHAFAEPTFDGGLPPPLAQAVDRMSAQQEPYPLMVLNRQYDVLRVNQSAGRLFGLFLARAEPVSPGSVNLVRLLFDPYIAQHVIVDWERTAREAISRIHRELLARPNDPGLAALLQSLLAHPHVPKEWRQPDLSTPSEPIVVFRLRHGDTELAFLTTITVFQAPQNVLLDEIVIESYFPFDDRTAAFCADLARA
ncbi:helix-turn-helix transcriptional regulator [Pendulispora rubella]|uniref:Helix-turn-helix transcriptional regulator n=1 Tax=Pendulispora rubella TaxID=2741070 RepID=A0ABZ2KXQ2_9BACT